MMERAELKQKARGSLKGNYGVAVGIALLNSVVLGVFSEVLRLAAAMVGVFSAGITSAASIFGIVFFAVIGFLYAGFSCILAAGTVRAHQNICEGRKTEIGDLFWGFKNRPLRFAGIGVAIVAVISICLLPIAVLTAAAAITGDGRFAVLFISIYSAILAVAAIYLYLTFGLFFYILVDKPTKTVWKALKESRVMMTKKRLRLAALKISFLGWYVISLFSFGIGNLWLNSYRICTTCWFYKSYRDLYSRVVIVEPDRLWETVEKLCADYRQKQEETVSHEEKTE